MWIISKYAKPEDNAERWKVLCLGETYYYVAGGPLRLPMSDYIQCPAHERWVPVKAHEMKIHEYEVLGSHGWSNYMHQHDGERYRYAANDRGELIVERLVKDE